MELTAGIPARGDWHVIADALRVLAMVGPANDTWTDTEASVVSAALDGDGEAFAQIVETHQNTIAVQMRRFTRDPATIEQLVHDVFVEAYVSLKSYRSHAPLVHWLRKIAVRVGYRYWKQQSRESAVFSEAKEGLDCIASGTITKVSDFSDVIGVLLQQLSPRDRLVLTLLYWDGCTVAEAAQLAGWSRSMVKVQAHRARKRLKRLIEESAS